MERRKREMSEKEEKSSLKKHSKKAKAMNPTRIQDCREKLIKSGEGRPIRLVNDSAVPLPPKPRVPVNANCVMRCEPLADG